jgi:hypothetical protein
MNNHAQAAVYALECARGDDLWRARRAFANCSQSLMDEPYGESGKTRREILEGYEAHEARINAAIAWVKRVGDTP